jgi:hypothetical protein
MRPSYNFQSVERHQVTLIGMFPLVTDSNHKAQTHTYNLSLACSLTHSFTQGRTHAFSFAHTHTHPHACMRTRTQTDRHTHPVTHNASCVLSALPIPVSSPCGLWSVGTLWRGRGDSVVWSVGTVWRGRGDSVVWSVGQGSSRVSLWGRRDRQAVSVNKALAHSDQLAQSKSQLIPLLPSCALHQIIVVVSPLSLPPSLS